MLSLVRAAQRNTVHQTVPCIDIDRSSTSLQMAVCPLTARFRLSLVSLISSFDLDQPCMYTEQIYSLYGDQHDKKARVHRRRVLSGDLSGVDDDLAAAAMDRIALGRLTFAVAAGTAITGSTAHVTVALVDKIISQPGIA